MGCSHSRAPLVFCHVAVHAWVLKADFPTKGSILRPDRGSSGYLYNVESSPGSDPEMSEDASCPYWLWSSWWKEWRYGPLLHMRCAFLFHLCFRDFFIMLLVLDRFDLLVSLVENPNSISYLFRDVIAFRSNVSSTRIELAS